MRLGVRRAGAAVVLAGVLAACATAAESQPAGPPVEALSVAPDDDPFQGSVLSTPAPLPATVLTDTDGRPFVWEEELAGTVSLVFFGYTSCPDVCPTHLANLASVLATDPLMAQQVEVVFVGVDPARDTPERVRVFLDRFDPRFIGLTGTLAEVEAAQREAGVPVAVLEEPDADGRYLVGHAGQLLAYGPDATARLAFPFGTRQTVVAHDLALLVAGEVPGGASGGAGA